MTPDAILLGASLLVAAFAAAAETALTSISRIRLRSLAELGNRRAQRVQRMRENPNQFLTTILGLNAVALIVAATATTLIAVNGSFSEGLATVFLALFTLVVCEIVPKSLALRFNEPFALALATPVRAVTRLLRPIIGPLTWVSTVPLRLATRTRDVRGPFVTEQELRMLVSVGEREGVVEQEEREMIQGVLELTDKYVREVMVPRVDVIGVEASKSLDEVTRVIIATGHSRIPVFEESLDTIVGVVYAKDILRHHDGTARSLREISREPYYTPEAKRAGELLHDMQQRKVHFAIVVDEYGGTAGIVTLEDLTEEIVGPIRDEYDVAEPEEVEFINDHEALVSARVSVDDVCETLHLKLPETEADSIGGFVYEQLGEIPKPGATVTLGDATLVVESVRRQGIRTVRITSSRPLTGERDGENGDDRHDPAAEQAQEA